ncbi:MAG: aminoglycoside phosphotransferase [Rhodospirillaceae bacterium]|nr:MAG: aminoglycoside phosphotransferase [Rhodospirillaceae bacterium]
MTQQPSNEHLRAVAEGLVGQVVRTITPVHGGGNNRIYKVDCADGLVALKFYPPQDEDPRDRLGQEYDALSFLTANGIGQVPTPLGLSLEHHCAAYQWIDGKRINTVQAKDVDALAGFLAQLQDLRGLDGGENLRPASASCFSFKDVADQLTSRFALLQKVAHDLAGSANDLQAFLDTKLLPTAEAVLTELTDACERGRLSFDTPLAQKNLALSPSDFGFHNALQGEDGQITFIDFEYFGWDDPVKMISDVMLHPGSNLSPELAIRFRDQIAPIFSHDDAVFSLRLRLLYPVFGLIWCAILLNEFLPERWARREAAGHSGAEASRTRQLNKAFNLYQRLYL